MHSPHKFVRGVTTPQDPENQCLLKINPEILKNWIPNSSDIMKIQSMCLKSAYFFLFLIFLCSQAFSEINPFELFSLSRETFVLKLPEDNLNWKERNRVMTLDYYLVERIPVDQDPVKWCESIGIEMQREKSAIHRTITIDSIAETIKRDTARRLPGVNVTWNQLYKSRSELLYEMIIHSQHTDTPPSHEITRVFLTREEVHRIGFSRRYEEMSKAEREKWIEILQKNVSLECLANVSMTKGSISIL